MNLWLCRCCRIHNNYSLLITWARVDAQAKMHPWFFALQVKERGVSGFQSCNPIGR